MMRFTEVRKRDVVATDSAETVARVDALVVDPGSRAISAVRLGKVKSGDGEFVSWSDLTAFGQDVVTIPSVDVVREATGDREPDLKKKAGVLGKRVLDDAGFELGEVAEVEFDPATGSVTTLITAKHQITGDRLLGIGTYAVVVQHAST